MKETETGTIQSQKYQESPYRYLIVILFALPSFCNGMCWVVISPISTVIEEVYGVSRWLVTLIPMLYMIMYILVNFLSNWVLDSKGIRAGVLIGTILTAVGASIRCFINTSFSFLVIGQMLCAAGQPFILNAPAKIATFWFSKQNRPLAIAVLSIVNMLGNGFGFALSSIYVDDQIDDPDITKKSTQDLMIVEALMSTVAAVLVVALFREKPRNPPSVGAEIQKMPFKQSLRVLFTSQNFLSLLAGFSFIFGTFSYFGAVINYILVPFKYSDNQISLFGGLAVFVGIVGACIFCPIAQKTGRYKQIILLCSVIASVSLFLHPFFLYFGNIKALVLISLLFVGFSITPLIPVSFDLGCSMQFPVGEAQVTGVLMTGAQIVAIVESILMQNITEDNSQSSVFVQLIILSGICMCGAACMFLMKPKLKRDIEENQQNKIQTSSAFKLPISALSASMPIVA